MVAEFVTSSGYDTGLCQVRCLTELHVLFGGCMNRAFAVLAWLCLPALVLAQEAGTFTLVEGAPRIIRGTAVLRGVEGMRFQTGDIIETSSPGFLQADFASGAVVAIGPGTRVWVRSAGGKSDTRADLVLMSGWLKGESPANGGAYHYGSPLLSATAKGGSIILHSASAGADIYIETGTAAIFEAAGRGQPAKAGQFFTRRPPKHVVVGNRPDGEFLASMPQPFRDTLPSRLSHFAGKKAVEPKLDRDVTYADVEPWLKLGAGRRTFEQRFQSRLRDADFRKAVEPHLAEYPEWDRVLHPEKYQQDSPAAPTESAKTPSGKE